MFRVAFSLCLFGVSGCGLIWDFDPWPPTDAPDGSIDSGNVDLDASFYDGGVGDGSILVDANLPDGSLDSGHIDLDGGMRRCEDTTEGICIRFTDTEGSPAVIGWGAEYHWTAVGGSDYVVPWHVSCEVGFRTVDARTTECEYIVPEPGMPTVGGMTIFAYPTYLIGPACTSTACPEFYAGYELWIDGISYSTNPGDGIVSLERRTTPSGMILVVRINPP